MKNKILLILFIFFCRLTANDLLDSDLDGVIDKIDSCPNTPFNSIVDKKGCTTKTLTLPQDSLYLDNIILSFGYGFDSNEDLNDHKKEHIKSIKINYYKKSWSFSLLGSYSKQNKTKDTIFTVKKNILISDNLKQSFGIGIKFPTYNINGNRSDLKLLSSLNYYKDKKSSYFGGIDYTIIRDRSDINRLRNRYTIYIGSGYFFNNNLYANITYSYHKSKFLDEDGQNSLGTTIYYQFNKKYFSTLGYKRVVGDEDLHDSFRVKFGIYLW